MFSPDELVRATKHAQIWYDKCEQSFVLRLNPGVRFLPCFRCRQLLTCGPAAVLRRVSLHDQDVPNPTKSKGAD